MFLTFLNVSHACSPEYILLWNMTRGKKSRCQLLAWKFFAYAISSKIWKFSEQKIFMANLIHLQGGNDKHKLFHSF